jgi:hypothetical protein
MTDLATERYVSTSYGYCYYEINPEPLIYNLHVYKKFRGMGFSRRLLQMVISEIKSTCDYQAIKIEAKSNEKGISEKRLKAYYTSLGLVLIG